MILREFTSEGTRAFRDFLATCREDPTTPVPSEWLEDDAKAVVVNAEIVVEHQEFANRREAAEYLTELLSPLNETQITKNAGLWTWLSLFFFDQVCPERNGKRTVRNPYHYAFEPNATRYFYRHLLYLAWRIQRVSPIHNRLFLEGPVSRLDNVSETVFKSLYLTRIPCIFEVLDRLYWDEERGRPRQGIVSPEKVSPGDLRHRLPLRIRQLEMTYDLNSLNADALMELLGNEFRQFANASS